MFVMNAYFSWLLYMSVTSSKVVWRNNTVLTRSLPHRMQEILEMADDMAIDIPHIWLYLGELITPMLQEGGIPMGQLFR